MAAADDPYVPPEKRARRRIDAMLAAAGWVVQDAPAKFAELAESLQGIGVDVDGGD